MGFVLVFAVDLLADVGCCLSCALRWMGCCAMVWMLHFWIWFEFRVGFGVLFLMVLLLMVVCNTTLLLGFSDLECCGGCGFCDLVML